MARRIGTSAEFARPARGGGTEQALQYTLDGLLQAIGPAGTVRLFGRELAIEEHAQLEVVAPPRPRRNRHFQDRATLRLEALPVDHWQVAEARIELAGALLGQAPRNDERGQEAARPLADGERAKLDSVGHQWIRARAERLDRLLPPTEP